MNLPYQPGINKSKRLYGDEAGGAPLQKIRSGYSLQDLTADYVLFTYAPFCIYSGIDFNPIQEWINFNNFPQIVFIIKLDTPFISCHSLPEWDCTLWAVEKNYWDSLALHIGSTALIDRTKKLFTRVICQKIPIIDVVAISKQQIISDIPKVDIYVFGVDSNIACIATLPEPARLTRIIARDDTVKLANNLFAEITQPYINIQKKPWES